MNSIDQYIQDRDKQVKENLSDRDLRVYTKRFERELVRTNYIKNFTWEGVPILQYPTDLMVIQELIWIIAPDFIIETGVAFGGMSKFYSSILKDMGDGYGIYSIDINPRPDIKEELGDTSFIHFIEGSSIDPCVVDKIKSEIINQYHENPRVFISLDSNHTHAHVLKELELYSPLVSVGSYIIVMDTQAGEFDNAPDRPWGKDNNPGSAVREFMSTHADEFVVDKEVEQRAVITCAPGGWLRRIK
jgi:cephalosporin hydroxylase